MSEVDKETRIKCIKCERMPLVFTAKANNGLCGVCFRDYEIEQIHKSRDQYLQNPPKTLEDIEAIAPEKDFDSFALRTFLHSIRVPFINPNNFSKIEFINVIFQFVDKYRDNHENMIYEFEHLCDPIANSNSIIKKGFAKIPTPFKEIYCLYCAQGVVGGDGFYCYIETYKKWFDKEVERAYDYLSIKDLHGLLSEVRSVYKKYKGEVPEEIDDELWEKWYEPIRDLNEKYIIPFLIKYADEYKNT